MRKASIGGSFADWHAHAECHRDSGTLDREVMDGDRGKLADEHHSDRGHDRDDRLHHAREQHEGR